MANGDFLDVAAQDLHNPFMEGYLAKRRPSKKLLSVKYQKRWCVIYESTFYYYDKDTDRKQKGAFSLEGYTFFERENPLTFDLKCYGKRTFEFIASNFDEFKRWQKAVKKASVYRCGPTEKKTHAGSITERPAILELNCDKQTDPSIRSKDWRQRSDLRYSRSPRFQSDRRRTPSPEFSQADRTPNYQSRRRRAPSPDFPPNTSREDRQSVDEDDGYIKVLPGQRIPVMPCRFSPSVEKRGLRSDERSFKNKNDTSSTIYSHPVGYEVKDSKSGNEDLYLELVDGEIMNSSENNSTSVDWKDNGDSKKSNLLLKNEPIYANTAVDSIVALPKKIDRMKMDDLYSKVNKTGQNFSDSEEDSTDSELDDYENADIF